MEKVKLFCRATVLWNSGREEVFQDKLKKDGKAPAKFVKKVRALQDFPTVQSVKVETY